MTVARSPSALPEAYARWQERFAHSFFAGRAHEPVVLFVDRDELQRLAPALHERRRVIGTPKEESAS